MARYGVRDPTVSNHRSTGASPAVALSLLAKQVFDVVGSQVEQREDIHLLTPLGIDPYNDGGTLFKEACTNLAFSAAILVIRRHEILPLLRQLVTDPRVARCLRVLA